VAGITPAKRQGTVTSSERWLRKWRQTRQKTA
jgi:hypothetical protein